MTAVSKLGDVKRTALCRLWRWGFEYMLAKRVTTVTTMTRMIPGLVSLPLWGWLHHLGQSCAMMLGIPLSVMAISP